MKFSVPLFLAAGMFFLSAGSPAQGKDTVSASVTLNSLTVIRPESARTIAKGVTVIPDPRINYVPNIGIIEGADAILVVDTGMGPRNGQLVFDYARKIAGKRRIYLTTTHFHPEHNFGASAFDPGSIILNKAQADELAEKGQDYISLFRSFGATERAALKDVVLVKPGITYRGTKILDLGGQTVELREMPAHTKGDQIVFVKNSGVVFLGDLVENRFFPIMPDADAKGERWIQVADAILALQPKIVVPGHGDVGDASLVRNVRDYLITVQNGVKDCVALGMNQDEIVKALAFRFAALHPDWDNAVFIPYEIAIYYSEATGQKVHLPDLSKDLQN